MEWVTDFIAGMLWVSVNCWIRGYPTAMLSRVINPHQKVSYGYPKDRLRRLMLK